MNEFRDKLKLQNLGIGLCCFVLAGFCFLAAAGEAGLINLVPATDDIHWQHRWRGIMMGSSWALLMMQIAFLVRNIMALKDEKKLKKLYVETNDEREIQIWTAARSTAMQIYLMVGLVAAIIAGYFSVIVGITILACIFTLSMIGLGCSAYYKMKF
jgi:hypothetical protein